MAWFERFFGRDYDRNFGRRDNRGGYARDFHYRSPLDRGWDHADARRRGERFFGGYDRGNYQQSQRPFPRQDRGAVGYGREYSSGVGYDPYYDRYFERGENDFSRGDRRLREYDRGFRHGPSGYDRYF